MTDSELSSLLHDLRNSAQELNQETGSINVLLAQVEQQIAFMNLGLECWVKRECLARKNPGKDSEIQTQLGYAKVAGSWCLSVREVRIDFDDRIQDWAAPVEGEPIKLMDSSRDFRIDAMRLLPLLLSELKARAEAHTRTILDTKKLVGW